MKLIVAYDKNPPGPDHKEKDNPQIKVLKAILETFSAHEWLQNTEDQFSYPLNTTIEVEIPGGQDKADMIVVVNEIRGKLLGHVKVRIGFGEMYGTENEILSQTEFHNLINRLKSTV